MATVNKDFKIKHGLIVEGATATVNGNSILTEDASDQYILDLIGGETLVKSVSNEFDVSAGGELSLDRAVVDTFYDAAGSADAAQSAAEATASADATSKANAAQSAAESTASADATSKANAAQSAAESTASADATSKANAAQSAAEATASADATSKANAAQSAAESTASADATSKANAAQSAAEATASADATSKANAAQSAAEATASADATSKADAAEAAANTYTDGAVAGLVDSAPELLDTLNELAAALQDNPDVITDLATLVATKASTEYVNSEISDLDTELKTYADTAEADAITAAAADATTKANAAQSAAEATASADATSKANAAQAAAEATASADATSKANAAQSAAEATASADATAKADAAEAAAIAHADALDTDDVAEGTAQYFTDARAKTSAADLLTGATLSNITITGSGSGLVITAENGVADSDTDDLTEGATNLYFTDARAVDALEAVVPNFTAVEINSLAKQVAATIAVSTASQVTAFSFAKAEYRSAKFLIKTADGTHTELTEVLLTLDSSDNIAITEYATIGTNGSSMTVTADVDGANVRLRVTTLNNTSDVNVVGTLLA